MNIIEYINTVVKSETSDFLIVCENKKFKCHKTILSAGSPVFSSGIAKMKEGETWGWVVKDSNPETVVDIPLFIYTGEIYYHQVLERLLEMLQLANFYRLHNLAVAFRKMLLWQLYAENTVMTLFNMERYKETDEKAKNEVKKFIKKNDRDVVNSSDWDIFQSNHGSLVQEVLKAIVN